MTNRESPHVTSSPTEWGARGWAAAISTLSKRLQSSTNNLGMHPPRGCLSERVGAVRTRIGRNGPGRVELLLEGFIHELTPQLLEQFLAEAVGHVRLERRHLLLADLRHLGVMPPRRDPRLPSRAAPKRPRALLKETAGSNGSRRAIFRPVAEAKVGF